MGFFMGFFVVIYMGYPLVGGVPTPLKNDGLRQLGFNMETYSKPPTSQYPYHVWLLIQKKTYEPTEPIFMHHLHDLGWSLKLESCWAGYNPLIDHLPVQTLVSWYIYIYTYVPLRYINKHLICYRYLRFICLAYFSYMIYDDILMYFDAFCIVF